MYSVHCESHRIYYILKIVYLTLPNVYNMAESKKCLAMAMAMAAPRWSPLHGFVADWCLLGTLYWRTVLYITVHCSLVHCSLVHCSVVHCSVVHCSVVHCSVVHSSLVHFSLVHFCFVYHTVYHTLSIWLEIKFTSKILF